MGFRGGWSRRRFLAVSGGAAAAGLKGFAQTGAASGDAAAAQRANAQEAARVMPPPEVISGGIQPLMDGMTARPLRYRPVAGEFVIRNGGEYFNRPIYGISSAAQAGGFRVDAGDLPEFSLYLPGHGGNLKLGFVGAGAIGSKWAAQADEVVARYRPGRMIYEIRDALLGKGMLRAELLTAGEGSGLMVKVEGNSLPAGTRLAWAFGGVSGRKGRRDGDIGCEVEPVSKFFQVRPEECSDNSYTFNGDAAEQRSVRLHSKAAEMVLSFPKGSSLGVEDFKQWTEAPGTVVRMPTVHLAGAPEWAAPPGGETKQPILTGSVELGNASVYVTLDRVADASAQPRNDPATPFATRSAQVEAIAATLKIDTPDEYINAAGGAIGIVAETLWDAKQECVMHGGVAWRVALAGWRGPYCLDALGTHDRAKLHFRHWLKKQNVTPVTTADPAIGAADEKIHLARKEGMLHSNGDLSNNHYDMNMVFMDVLLRHLMWTGDMDFAREIWPALQRHLAWEHRMFRRTYASADGKQLPLHEAYAAIWASDNLQYNGGGAAHSTAYNIFALSSAAKIAKLLGEDGSAYQAETDATRQGMEELLWVKERGMYAESKDLLGPQTVYTNPALWTVYHAIDSEVPDAAQAWQMCAERLAALKHVPIHGDGVPMGGWYMLSCSDWMPYLWSLNLLLLAENAHMALAMWQTGMRDEAYRIFKGSLLDSMYMGLCPGDFHMTSALDAHRQEAQRDFGDPTGISSRALVEGLFGVQPDLITGEIRIRPGFPSDWDRASLKHKDFDFAWKRENMRESYEFTSRLAKAVPVRLEIPARTTNLPAVTNNGTRVECVFNAATVGGPTLWITLPAGRAHRVSLEWHGDAPTSAPAQRSYAIGAALELPRGVGLAQIEDPQGCLSAGHITSAGFHTVFAKMQVGECKWSMPISFDAKAQAAEFAAVPAVHAGARMEHVDLSSVLKNQATEIFTRVYAEPRSPYCSLAIPDTLIGGWANADGTAKIDDAGLRAAGGMLRTGLGVDFATPTGSAPNCLFLSHWKQDVSSMKLALSGRAEGIYLLMTGSTNPQCSRIQHGTVSITYIDGSVAKLRLSNPENWWPIEQDYLIDDYLFVNDAPLPARVDLRTGTTRVLDAASFKGKGRTVPGGAATILHLPLDASKQLASLQVNAELYGIVVGLLAATLVRG